jgi:hypothetical protein
MLERLSNPGGFAGHAARAEYQNVSNILIIKPEEKRIFEKHSRWRKDNNQIILKLIAFKALRIVSSAAFRAC